MNFHSMKIFRTIIIVLAVLVSIFFTVHSNIQAELAQEEKAMRKQLEAEAENLAEMALQEATRVVELENALQKCKSGELVDD